LAFSLHPGSAFLTVLLLTFYVKILPVASTNPLLTAKGKHSDGLLAHYPDTHLCGYSVGQYISADLLQSATLSTQRPSLAHKT
jgi:hypothetical protein